MKRRTRWLALAGLLLAVTGAGIASQTGDARQVALPEISIDNASVLQYQTGNVTMTFHVTLSSSSTTVVTVDYTTRAGDAHVLGDQAAAEQEDFLPTSGTLTFSPGETAKTIDVTVVGEPGILSEPDEYFAVDLFNSVNAVVVDGSGTGTIHLTKDPRPGDVNVETVGPSAGQCVQTVNTLGCVPLNGETQLKVSEIQFVNPGKGAVALQSVAGKANFYGSPFTLKETTLGTKKKRPVLLLQLAGGNFGVCRAGATKSSTGSRSTTIALKSKKPVRRLFGNGKGRFRTKGRYSAGTVRGTFWVTIDRCDGTLTQVFRGVVSVHDLVLNKYVKVRAGHYYLASPSKKK